MLFCLKKSISKFHVVALALLFAVTVAGCGGGSSTSTADMDGDGMTMPEPTAYKKAKAAIAGAETAEDAQAAYDAVKDDVTAAEGEKLQAAVDSRVDALMAMTRQADQKQALMTAADMVDTSDLSTAEAIAAANTAIVALQAALDAADDVSDADKAIYQSQLDTAGEAVRMAQTGLDTAGRMMAQRTDISNAVTAARSAVNMVDDDATDAQVTAADNAVAALKAAIGGAEDLPEGDADVASAQGTLDTLGGQLSSAKKSRMVAIDLAIDKKNMADMKAMADTGKAMYAALAGTDTANTTALDNATVALGATDLTVTAAAGAGAHATGVTPPVAILKAGDSAGALGSWNGMNYAHTDAGTKVMNAAVVYTNKGSGKTVSFADAGHIIITADGPNKGYVEVIDENLTYVMATAFAHSGTQNHPIPDESNAFYTRGTYDGAPGRYRCTGTCSSANDDKGSPSELGGTWHFKPDAGANAMAHQPDANYLYYGWWVSKDKDGMPTAASAFTGIGGMIDALTDDPESAVTGSATYAGHAAGKFAMNNPVDGTGDGGHFTADATLTAKFGTNDAPNNGGVSGTIDNFMANDKSVPWSVTLNRAQWGTNGAFTSTADTTNTTAEGTVWSIDGNKAAESGTWSGQMYDEKPGNAPVGDGSNIPTSVTGTFYSEFSTIGRMVGAFGAEKE